MRRVTSGAVAMAMVVAGGACGAVSGNAHAAAGASDPAALVHRLYADEAVSRAQQNPLWWRYLTGRAQALFAHVQRVQKATGEGLIDEDFLCQCQDPTGMRLTSVVLSNRTPKHVTAHVRFAWGGGPQNGSGALKLELVEQGAGWKIAQMTNSHGQTFTAEQTAALKPYPGR